MNQKYSNSVLLNPVLKFLCQACSRQTEKREKKKKMARQPYLKYVDFFHVA